jgi:hypothetical protein
VVSPERLPQFPDLPTVAETLPGFEAGGWLVLLAPAGTPATVVAKANADLIKALGDPEIRKRTADLGWDQRPMSPADALAFIQREQQKWGPIVQQIAGIAIGLFLTGCLLPFLAAAQRTGVIVDWLFNHSSREPVFVDYATIITYFAEFALALIGAGYFRRQADRMVDKIQD